MLNADVGEVHVELVGGQHGQACVDALAHLGARHDDRDDAIGAECDAGTEANLLAVILALVGLCRSTAESRAAPDGKG